MSMRGRGWPVMTATQARNACGSEALVSNAGIASPPGLVRRLSRLLRAVRWDEVLVLQGAPLIGAIFSIREWTTGNILLLAVFAVGSCCLVAHVFVLNDWSGIQGDLGDPNRAPRTFSAKGVSRAEFGILAIALLALSLLLFALLGKAVLALALAIAGLSALYS